MVFTLLLTAHTFLRMAQRDIPERAIVYVLLHGDWHCIPDWKNGADRYEITLSRHHIPPRDRAEFNYLAGTVIIIEDPGTVITSKKQRSKETDLRLPYVRETGNWRRYLGTGFLH